MSGERRPDRGIIELWESICGTPPGALIDAYRALPPRQAAASQAASEQIATPSTGDTAVRPASHEMLALTRRLNRLTWAVGVLAVVVLAVTIYVVW